MNGGMPSARANVTTTLVPLTKSNMVQKRIIPNN